MRWLDDFRGHRKVASGEETTRRHLTLLLLFAVLVYFVGNGAMAITDSVESNYVETAKEMMAAGDLISPRIYGHYWYDKPVLFYWELIAAFEGIGYGIGVTSGDDV